jgi:hypothetical protein
LTRSRLASALTHWFHHRASREMSQAVRDGQIVYLRDQAQRADALAAADRGDHQSH